SELNRRASQDLFSRVSGRLYETVVDVDVQPVLEGSDAGRVCACGESFFESVFALSESFFGVLSLGYVVHRDQRAFFAVDDRVVRREQSDANASVLASDRSFKIRDAASLSEDRLAAVSPVFDVYTQRHLVV